MQHPSTTWELAVPLLEFLPDLSGQPWWVLVLVVILFVSGSVGTAWIRHRPSARKTELAEGEEDDGARPGGDEGAPPALTRGDPHATLVIKQALDLLASEAGESSAARAESEALRLQLVECSRQREEAERRLELSESETRQLRNRLDACNAECRKLARKALGLEGTSDE
jgi:hypothetical protein